MDRYQLIEELRKTDEITILELLEINSQDLIDQFLDKIEDKESMLVRYFSDN